MSSILKFGLGSWNKTPALSAALNTLIASTEAHEIAHGTLAQRALAEKDPATQLEALVVPPGADIVEAADNILRAADADLGWASRDEKVAEELWKQERFRGGGSVRFNRDAEPTPIDPFAKLGAEGPR